MLSGETKGEEREGFSWFGEQQMWGKPRNKGIKGLAVCMLVWPCPVPDQCSLSCLIKSPSSTFPVWGTHSVCEGISGGSLGGGDWSHWSCHCVWVLATGETRVTENKSPGAGPRATGVCVPLVPVIGVSVGVQVSVRGLAQTRHDQPGSRWNGLGTAGVSKGETTVERFSGDQMSPSQVLERP